MRRSTALIHPDIPCPDNVGYLFDDGALYHPGDAYYAPYAPVRTLLLPTSGPWTKLGEAADYVRTVKPERVIQIHELMLSDLGQHSTANLLGEKGLTGIPITCLEPGTSIQL
ncbi:MBL fold metallo-hydrolase [Streptomyces misionensis]|uniref:MBL fold metallo-hydrolase n=1 Tax=Streptomyces misionensis TaxID=67331 RepID=UPI0021BDC566|nr:MBL fold metallo-hydrolase [Streptomyces misionensis]